jgi:hypothetical protein
MNRNVILLLVGLGVVGYGAVQSCRSTGGGSGAAVTEDTDGAGGRIATISRGEAVDVAAHAQPSGRTIIDFGAVW